uniref:Secreted protein n=1 Tax=Acrobeloides nanus TaxID=290746 RepID=A0A914C9L0_9BILA
MKFLAAFIKFVLLLILTVSSVYSAPYIQKSNDLDDMQAVYVPVHLSLASDSSESEEKKTPSKPWNPIS